MKLKNHCVSMFAIMALAHCGLPARETSFASEKLPYVVSVTPEDGTISDTLPHFTVTFSKPMDPDSVTSQTLFIMSAISYENYSPSAWTDLYEDATNGDVATIGGKISFTEDATGLEFEPLVTAASDDSYVLVALPKITSADRFPLDQTAMGSATSVFLSKFLVSRGSLPGSDNDVPSTSSDGDDATETATAVPEPTSENSNATPPSNDDTSDDTSPADAANVPASDPAAQSETESFDFERLLITEVVTDPQQDHGESSEGNGIKFDFLPGSGTVGTTDEYIEITNGTDDTYDLTDWQILMTDGSDVSERVNDSAWTPYFSANGSVTEFFPGEVIVLGNPTGDMKNTVTVDLLDAAGTPVDSVVIDDGNASSLEDEAFQLSSDGDWIQGSADPGVFDPW